MDSSGYISITRQSGLLKELQTVANNIANLSTTGFRREGLVFAETVRPLDGEGGGISMATARARFTDDSAGDKTLTGGKLDLAIDGPGFFLLDTPDGQRLTRAGGFSSSGDGFLMTPTGYNVLDSGGAPIFLPPDGGEIGISRDGTISVQGRPIAQVGIYEVEFPEMLQREGGVMFSYDGEPTPAENSTVQQGYVEGSNVDAVVEMARLIEVQRAYELGQNLLEGEDERIRASIRTLGRAT